MNRRSLLSSCSCALLLLAIAWQLTGCGGGGGSTPTSVTPPTQDAAARTVLLTKPFNLQPGTATFQNVDLPPAGTLDAVVDWNGSNDINLFVTDNSCPGFVDLRAGRCNVVARADGPSTKPEKVSFTTTAGKIWSFWIANNGSSAETGNMEVGITTTGPVPPAPAPTPSTGATPDPQAGLAPGPIVRYTIKVRTIDQGTFNYRDPYQDDQGFWIVHKDEFVVFDSTQKNAGGELCRWINNPTWSITDPDGVFALRGSSQPFLLRTDIAKNKGEVEVKARIDGVESNALKIKAIKR